MCRSSIDPSRIVFELTETAVMRDFAVAETSIRLLRNLGSRIALDDFGTGQSSLSYLRHLPIDIVKIDRRFVSDATNNDGRDLLAAIISLCANLKIGCVAEGVETEMQLSVLRSLGCDSFQGYFFSRPLPSGDLLAWLGASQRVTPIGRMVS